MKKYSSLLESLPAKTVVFAFGRFNPPTIGHELLIKLVKKLAQTNSADYCIYASATQDKKKNPLPVDRKLHYLNLMFPNSHFFAAGGDQRTFIEAAKYLNKKYKNLIMVAGSDRVADYQKILDKYNGKEYNFSSIKVISAGDRDPDADDATGMSASKMRAAASKNDLTSFKKGLPSTVRSIDAKRLMNEIRTGMGLEVVKEHIKFQSNALREAYINKEIFNIGDIVEASEQQFEIVDRGTNYLTVVDDKGQTHRKWLHECSVIDVVKEDIQPGYAPKEISFKGFTTKNLHHSGDAAKAFQSTIERYGKSDPATVLTALKATDAYMKLNDMHLEQGKAPDEAELQAWKEAHQKARDSLNRIGEFMHHEDYWHMHEHELQDMETKYNPDTAGADMNEELTDKTIRSGDKVKVARVIADMLGVENAESLSPEVAVNMGLRKLKNKRTTPEMLKVVHKMITLAQDVGIKVDSNLIPKVASEAMDAEPGSMVDPDMNFSLSKQIVGYKEFRKRQKVSEQTSAKQAQQMATVAAGIHQASQEKKKKDAEDEEIGNELQLKYGEVGTTLQPDVHANSNTVRLQKIRYKTEEAENVEEDMHSADYKVNPQTGRKYRAHHIDFQNSGMNAEPADDEKENGRKLKTVHGTPLMKKIKEETEADDNSDLTEDELEAMAKDIDDIDDIIDAYEDDEIVIVDDETGQQIKEELEIEPLHEVLSRMERIKARIRFARSASKRERRLKIVLKSRSNTATINKRARHLAINLMKQRLMKKKSAQMNVGEKERVERIIAKRKAVIDRLAMKLAPRIRKIENDRLSHKTAQ